MSFSQGFWKQDVINPSGEAAENEVLFGIVTLPSWCDKDTNLFKKNMIENHDFILEEGRHNFWESMDVPLLVKETHNKVSKIISFSIEIVS